MSAELLEKFVKREIETNKIKLPFNLKWDQIDVGDEREDMCGFYCSDVDEEKSEKYFEVYFIEWEKQIDYLTDYHNFREAETDNVWHFWVKNIPNKILHEIFTKPHDLPNFWHNYCTKEKYHILATIANAMGTRNFFKIMLRKLDHNASYFLLTPHTSEHRGKLDNDANLKRYFFHDQDTDKKYNVYIDENRPFDGS